MLIVRQPSRSEHLPVAISSRLSSRAGAKDYAGAYEHFKKAHGHIPTVHAEYWMAMSLSFGADVGAAYEALSAVVGAPDASKLGDEKLASLNERLAEIKKTPASVHVTSTPPGADVSLDGKSQPGITPLTLSVPAGLHKIGVALAGHQPFEGEFLAKPGQKLEQVTELAPEAAPPAAEPVAAPPPEDPPAALPPKEERSNLPAYITLGVAGAGAIVGTIFGIQALGAKSDFNKTPTTELADDAERDALICDMAFGVAITLGVTGVVLLTSDDEPAPAAKAAPAKAARLQLAPYAGKKSGGASAKLSF
jgi:hypothetical protein